jgi:hypothetical protein
MIEIFAQLSDLLRGAQTDAESAHVFAVLGQFLGGSFAGRLAISAGWFRPYPGQD